MSTVTSVNPGVAYLLQIFSNAGSPSLTSALSSSEVQSALQGASPADIAQLSDQALQLHVANDLFASADPSKTEGLFSAASPSSSSLALENLLTNLYSPTSVTSPPSPAPSLADQIATYQGNLQAEQLQAFFGVNPTSGTLGTQLDVLA
jgi:hypothetical protein